MNRKFILILLSVVAAIALLVFAVACGRTVTVTFDEGGATKTVSVKSGSVVQDYTPQKDGYEFSCWTEKESGAEFDFSQPITEDVTLVAVWQYARVTVRFDSAGGTAVPFQTFDKGGCASLPEAPQNGYKAFAGWYRQGEDEPFDFSLPVFESLTLVAKWETIRVAFASTRRAAPRRKVSLWKKEERRSFPKAIVSDTFCSVGMRRAAKLLSISKRGYMKMFFSARGGSQPTHSRDFAESGRGGARRKRETCVIAYS